MRIVVDEENNAEEFCEQVKRTADSPDELHGLWGEISAWDERPDEIEAWCEKAPGYATGPEYENTHLKFLATTAAKNPSNTGLLSNEGIVCDLFHVLSFLKTIFWFVQEHHEDIVGQKIGNRSNVVSANLKR